jgi:outer membrane lipase/esterase
VRLCVWMTIASAASSFGSDPGDTEMHRTGRTFSALYSDCCRSRLALRLGHALAALGVAVVCSGAVAQAAPFTSFWALGDSLSDDGNTFERSGGTEPPSPPYFDGRFSNGPVWSEYIAGTFQAKGRAAGNFAFGGASALPNPESPVPTLGQQVQLFGSSTAGLLGRRPVVSLWAGSNDLIFGGIPTGTAVATGRAAATAVADSARALGAFGVRDVTLFTLADLGGTPRYNLSPDAREKARATRGTNAFNATLDRQIGALEAEGINVIRIDTHRLFNQLLANPERFGVRDATFPCLVDRNTAPCTPAQALERAFFDPVHPNSVVHGQIAGVVSQQIAPVPLPAPVLLLVGGIAALGVVARRRRAAAA